MTDDTSVVDPTTDLPGEQPPPQDTPEQEDAPQAPPAKTTSNPLRLWWDLAVENWRNRATKDLGFWGVQPPSLGSLVRYYTSDVWVPKTAFPIVDGIFRWGGRLYGFTFGLLGTLAARALEWTTNRPTHFFAALAVFLIVKANLTTFFGQAG
ncbi:hypothetical protein ACFY05_31975 [Microtetraspora fusca]|uniref:DUF2628 domain-containing protein n=1 Tax=Microtetraspora fusca TaxID=1997 RepID=A0ABW6VDR5_MICFU